MTTQTHPGAVKTALVNLRRRRTYLIDPDTQFAVTRQFLLVLVAASGLSVGNYHVFHVMVEVNKQDSFELALAYGYCAAMLAVSATLLFLLCVCFSHRIAGPARKISEALDQMANRNLCLKVRLRDNDLLREIADAINATTRELRASMSDVEGEIRRAQACAPGSSEQRACLQRAEKLLAQFQITNSVELDAREAVSRGARKGSNAAA